VLSSNADCSILAEAREARIYAVILDTAFPFFSRKARVDLRSMRGQGPLIP